MENKDLIVKTKEVTEKNNKNSKHIKRILSLLLLLAIITGGVFYYNHHNQHHTSKYDGHAYNDPVKKGDTWSAGELVMPGFGEVPVNRTDKNIKITLGNPKINQAYFKYKVEVYQHSKKIMIESTKLIKPGNAITEIPTQKLSMKPGKYPMKITIDTFSLKNSKAPLNGSVIDATLSIK